MFKACWNKNSNLIKEFRNKSRPCLKVAASRNSYNWLNWLITKLTTANGNIIGLTSWLPHKSKSNDLVEFDLYNIYIINRQKDDVSSCFLLTRSWTLLPHSSRPLKAYACREFADYEDHWGLSFCSLVHEQPGCRRDPKRS